MNNYELFYLVSSSKTLDQVKEIKEQVNQILVKEKAKVLYHDIWTQTKLAYPIKRVEQAFYILCYFTAKTKALVKIKKAFLILNDILRSVIVKHDDLEPQIKRFVEKQEPKRFHAKVPEIDVSLEKKPKLSRSVVAAKPAETHPIKAKDEPKVEQTADKEKKAPKKPRKKSSLDEKLEDILGGEIEL
jgi:small subunit ribosomal protein S6